MEAIHRKIAAWYETNLSGKWYPKGEKVWLKVLQNTPKEINKKLDMRWLVPSKILGHAVKGRYKVSHPVSGDLGVHIDCL